MLISLANRVLAVSTTMETLAANWGRTANKLRCDYSNLAKANRNKFCSKYRREGNGNIWTFDLEELLLLTIKTWE